MWQTYARVFLPIRDDNPRTRFPAVTLLLIVANVIAFLFELSLDARGQKLLTLEAYDRSGLSTDLHRVENKKMGCAGNIGHQLQSLRSAFHQMYRARDSGIFFQALQRGQCHAIVRTNWIAQRQHHCSGSFFVVHARFRWLARNLSPTGASKHSLIPRASWLLIPESRLLAQTCIP